MTKYLLLKSMIKSITGHEVDDMTEKEEVVKISKKNLIIGVIVILIIVGGFLAYTYRKNFISSGESPELIELQVIALSVDCESCIDEETALQIVRDSPAIKLTKERVVESDSSKGIALIKKYGIEKLPAFIFVGDVGKLPSDNFKIVDNCAVLEPVVPPYIEVSTGDVRGIIDITYLVDKNCEECYDPQMLKSLFEQNFFMLFGKETEIDISSKQGKALLLKHSISKIPTLIFSSEASLHPLMFQIWPQIGKESSGEYILTELQQMPGITYKDLVTDELIVNEDMQEVIEDIGNIEDIENIEGIDETEE